MSKLNKKIIIANWKMKLSHKESINLAKNLAKSYKKRDDLEVVLCPSYNALEAVGNIISQTSFKLGAQNIFYHDSGSYTGEISPKVMRELGCEYAIIGHSERRKFGESDDDVNRKVVAALRNGLVPVICVGETFEEFQEKKTDVVIIRQITAALEDIKLKNGQRLILAYEPVWVIGSGQAVEHNIVGNITRIIIHTAVDLDSGMADKFDVIYGGSVDSQNVNDFIVGNLLKGVIVGGESLSAASFLKILKNIN